MCICELYEYMYVYSHYPEELLAMCIHVYICKYILIYVYIYIYIYIYVYM